MFAILEARSSVLTNRFDTAFSSSKGTVALCSVAAIIASGGRGQRMEAAGHLVAGAVRAHFRDLLAFGGRVGAARAEGASSRHLGEARRHAGNLLQLFVRARVA